MDDVDTQAAAALRGRLRALRKQRRLTLAQVQAALGGRFSQGAIGSWERGERMPALDTLVVLARFYGVTVGYLVAGEGDGPVVRAAAAEIRSNAVGLLLAARLHPELDPAARAALTAALRAGVPLWDLAVDVGRPGLALAQLIDDSQLQRSALRAELAAATDYTARVRAAVRAATPGVRPAPDVERGRRVATAGRAATRNAVVSGVGRRVVDVPA